VELRCAVADPRLSFIDHPVKLRMSTSSARWLIEPWPGFGYHQCDAFRLTKRKPSMATTGRVRHLGPGMIQLGNIDPSCLFDSAPDKGQTNAFSLCRREIYLLMTALRMRAIRREDCHMHIARRFDVVV